MVLCCVTNQLDSACAKLVSQAFSVTSACLICTSSLLETFLDVRFVTAILLGHYQEQFATKSMDNVFAYLTVMEDSVVSVNQVRE